MGLMEIPFQMILLIIFATTIFFMIYLIWRIRVTNIYQFEIVFMKPGVNPHKFIRGSSLDFVYEHESNKYNITSDRLYRVKPGLFTRIMFILKGINQRFIVVFQKGKKTPIAPQKVEVSSRILNEVKESRALDKALRGEWSIPWDLKKILLVMGFIVLVAVVYLVVTGQVVIG